MHLSISQVTLLIYFLIAGAHFIPGTAVAARPNFLWITSEDHGPHLGAYGEPLAKTPALDKLATEGVLYERAFSVAGVCAPARSSILTGHYPNQYGSSHMRTSASLPDSIVAFSSLLKNAGYWCSNNTKEDYNFPTPANAWNATASYNRSQAHWRNRPDPAQNFFAVFNFETTHESRLRSTSAYDNEVRSLPPDRFAEASSVSIPPYLPDTPLVRQDIAHVLDLIAALDQKVQSLLSDLEADGLAEETIVFYFSDHGDGLPRAKRWVYDSGLRIPMIIRIPAKWREPGQGVPGSKDPQLVSFVDLAPTMLHLAGLEIPPNLQGRPFLGKNLPPERDYIYAFRDRMDESFDTIRAVRSARYKYIRNYRPWEIPLQEVTYAETVPSAMEIRRLGAQRELPAESARLLGPGKPFEELYDLRHDPFEVHNLIHSAEAHSIQVELAGALDVWMSEIRDLGFIPEGILNQELNAFDHEIDILAGEAGLVRFLSIESAARTAADPAQRSPERLLYLLASPDPVVRYWAAQGCSALDFSELDRLIPDLLQALRQESVGTVRCALASALLRTEFDAPEAVENLVGILEDGSFFEQLEAASILEKAGARALAFKNRIDLAYIFRGNAPYTYLDRIFSRLRQRLQVDPLNAPVRPQNFAYGVSSQQFSWQPATLAFYHFEFSQDLLNWTSVRANMTGLPVADHAISMPLNPFAEARFFRLRRTAEPQ